MNKKPILSKESNDMKNKLNELISSHNTLCDICEVFEKNDIAKQYFEYGRDEVLESGNCCLAQMYAIAILRMCDFIKDNSDEDSDIKKLRIKLYKLENENRKLLDKLKRIDILLR